MKNKMPVILTFDVDGESLWLCRDPDNAKRPVTLSLGRYGIIEGVPRILRLLGRHGIPATFFVPGMIAERYPDMVKRIAGNQHEIGNHSYSHTYPDKLPSKEAERDELQRTNEILKGITGKVPEGYRSPAWEFSEHTLDLLLEMGFTFSSNMMHTDRIGLLEVFERKTEIVELPIHWVLDDAAFWLYSVRIVGKAMQPLDAVETYWKTEFDGLYEEFCSEKDSDICFVLTCHPQVIGRPARMKVLDNVIRHIKGHPDVEFLTCGMAAEAYRARHPRPRRKPARRK
jgi:peptidoglycan/xylan/chitin deacetylase (PgdA/CDA1 family)